MSAVVLDRDEVLLGGLKSACGPEGSGRVELIRFDTGGCIIITVVLQRAGLVQLEF